MECGIGGFGLYVFFFVTLIITLLAKLKRYSNASRPYMITSAIFTVAMIFLGGTDQRFEWIQLI